MSDQIRVLIVDDIPEKDIEVVGAAASGAEALQMAAAILPDVVLMDINMPDMDGITATELLSAQVPTTAIVMMSVQGEADYLRRSMLAGAREFLVKPFSSDELTASIRQSATAPRRPWRPAHPRPVSRDASSPSSRPRAAWAGRRSP